MQTLPDLGSCVQEDRVQVEFFVGRILRKSNWVHMWSTVSTYKGVQSKSKLQYSGTWSARAVIAQQYSSVTLISTRFRSHKE